MRHPLSDQYRVGRERSLDLGRGLAEVEGRTMTAACPAWSIKDVYAHLAGISTDILAGNTAEAATPTWADGHVADRRHLTLEQVLDEWETAGREVSEVMESVGRAFPPELFIDQWTHEWDIRAALGPRAAAVPDCTVFRHYFDELATRMSEDEAGRELDPMTVEVDGSRFVIGVKDGSRSVVGDVSFTMFEFARVLMGRRSRRQLRYFDWPMTDIDAHLAVLVRWSVADHDVEDPVIQAD